MHKRIKYAIYYSCGILLVALILQILSLIKNNEIFFPNVLDITKSFFSLLGEANTYLCIGTTLLELLISLAISFVIGVALGVLSGVSDAIYRILKPLMSILRTLPIIVLIVLLMLLTKLNYAPVIASTLVLIPIIYEGTSQGIKTIDKNLIDVYKLNSDLTFNIVLKVYLPLISSHSKSSFVSALGMGIKILITCEYICGVSNTLGRQIILASQNLEYEKIYAYSFILVILIMLIELLPNLISFIYRKINNQKFIKLEVEA